MKICPKCNTENSDTAQVCENCFTSIHKIKSVSNDSLTEEFFAREEAKEKRRKILKAIPMIIYYLLYIPLYIADVVMMREDVMILTLMLLFPGLYYIHSYKAKTLFYIHHVFDIQNIDEAEPSDWYILSSWLTGFVWLFIGLLFVIMHFFNL